MKVHFILYVEDQRASTAFYSAVLNAKPRLDEPGMTEFELASGAVLGLMPEAGAARLLGSEIIKQGNSRNSSGAEVYLIVQEPAAFHERAVSAGARELSPLQKRDWGHVVAYSLDPDGHVLAFAAEAA